MKTLRFSTARLHKNNLRTSSFAIFIPPPLSPPSLLFVLSILMDLSSLCTYVLRDALLLRSVPFADCFKSVLRRIAKKKMASNKQTKRSTPFYDKLQCTRAEYTLLCYARLLLLLWLSVGLASSPFAAWLAVFRSACLLQALLEVQFFCTIQ